MTMPFPCSKSALAFYWPWDETPSLCAVAPKTPSSSLIAGLVADPGKCSLHSSVRGNSL